MFHHNKQSENQSLDMKVGGSDPVTTIEKPDDQRSSSAYQNSQPGSQPQTSQPQAKKLGNGQY